MKIRCIFSLLLNVTDDMCLLYKTWIEVVQSCLEFLNSNSQNLYNVFLISMGGLEYTGELDGLLEGLGLV